MQRLELKSQAVSQETKPQKILIKQRKAKLISVKCVISLFRPGIIFEIKCV
jgi:hypothetical protein